MRWVLQKWDFFLAVILTVSGVHFLPNSAVTDITAELITFFSIQSAVILPAMIFTASILKPDGLDLNDAQRYHNALKSQMIFWVALLGLDFISVVSLILGKALKWSLIIPIPASTRSVDIGWILPCILYFSGSLAVFRTIPFVRGVLSLLDINSDMTQKAIKHRNRTELAGKKAQAISKPIAIPDGYGNIIDQNDQ